MGSKVKVLKPNKLSTLLCQIDVQTTNFKALAQPCKEVGAIKQSYYRRRKNYDDIHADESKN